MDDSSDKAELFKRIMNKRQLIPLRKWSVADCAKTKKVLGEMISKSKETAKKINGTLQEIDGIMNKKSPRMGMTMNGFFRSQSKSPKHEVKNSSIDDIEEDRGTPDYVKRRQAMERPTLF